MSKLEKFLFFSIISSIPLNLGKHFILESSFVYGKLIDYLIPTIYVQDILILALFLVWLFLFLRAGLSLGKDFFKEVFSSVLAILRTWEVAFLILFIASVFLSVLSAKFPVSAWYEFSRLGLYVFFALYTFGKFKFFQYKDYLLTIFAILLFLLSLLGIAQWIKQSSVFNNYLFFGEQPYSLSTPQIVKVNFAGVSRVPPYGTFRHPNTFAAYLVFASLLIIGLRPKKKIFCLPVFLGFFCLLLTCSRLGLAGFILGLLIILLPKKYIRPIARVSFATALFITILILLSNSVDPSTFRRQNLLLTGIALFLQYPLFGVGLDNFTYFVDLLSIELGFPKFTQPVHNFYLLLLVESGIFSLLFVLLFLASIFHKLIGSVQHRLSGKYPRLFLALLLSLLIPAFFDHFLTTSHQINLLFWLTIGLSLQYNLT